MNSLHIADMLRHILNQNTRWLRKLLITIYFG
jgi:hypothetical protein